MEANEFHVTAKEMLTLKTEDRVDMIAVFKWTCGALIRQCYALATAALTGIYVILFYPPKLVSAQFVVGFFVEKQTGMLFLYFFFYDLSVHVTTCFTMRLKFF